MNKKLIRSKYPDIMVKVDTDVYHLDRLQLARHSDYFEKLFTEDFHEKKCDLIELPIMDSDTFSTILDIIYGDRNLESVLKIDNYISLLMAMDYLQIIINLADYRQFIENDIKGKPFEDTQVFSLYQYVAENRNFNYLLPAIFEYLSRHLEDVQNDPDFPYLPIDDVVNIISSQQCSFSEINTIRDCSQICIKWVFHDVENRLPRIFRLVNAVRNRFRFLYKINEENSGDMMRNIGEETTPDSVLRYFQKLVAHLGEMEEGDTVVQELNDSDGEGCIATAISNNINQKYQEKMARLLEHGYFYDITIKVEEKTYKLHRYLLNRESEYFTHIFSTDLSKETLQPNKDEEYLLNIDGVDQATFDLLTKYIYYDEIKLNSNSILQVLKSVNILKMKRLLAKCELWIKVNAHTISFDIIVKILNFIHENENLKLERIYRHLLCKRILADWSEIDDVSPFCVISIDMLEDILVSSALHMPIESSLPPDFCIYDHHDLLDICSKWIIHDVNNRYPLIPRIAFAINCNSMLHYGDYKMETVLDFTKCWQKFVRNNLWKMLSSTSLIPRDSLSKKISSRSRKFNEEPMFIASEICPSSRVEFKICILNAEFDEIASWCFRNVVGRLCLQSAASATTIGDIVFIVHGVYTTYEEADFFISFQAYNISTKKFTSLACITPKMNITRTYVLLNCRENVYCCFDNGLVLKYSIQLNRWMRISMPKTDKKDVKFTSNGKTLYRMYGQKTPSSLTIDYIFEGFNFEQKTWVSLGLTLPMESYYSSMYLIVINGSNLGIVFTSALFIVDRLSNGYWHQRSVSLPERCESYRREYHSTLIQCENGMLYVCNANLYQLSPSDQNWQLKKKLQTKRIYGGYLNEGGFVSGIHRPTARVNHVNLW